MSNAFLIYLVLCLIVGFLGRRTRLGMTRSTLLSFLLTPLVMFVYLLLFAATAEDGDRAMRGDR